MLCNKDIIILLLTKEVNTQNMDNSSKEVAGQGRLGFRSDLVHIKGVISYHYRTNLLQVTTGKKCFPKLKNKLKIY